VTALASSICDAARARHVPQRTRRVEQREDAGQRLDVVAHGVVDEHVRAVADLLGMERLAVELLEDAPHERLVRGGEALGQETEQRRGIFVRALGREQSQAARAEVLAQRAVLAEQAAGNGEVAQRDARVDRLRRVRVEPREVARELPQRREHASVEARLAH
jgi:hypothetical protein